MPSPRFEPLLPFGNAPQKQRGAGLEGIGLQIDILIQASKRRLHGDRIADQEQIIRNVAIRIHSKGAPLSLNLQQDKVLLGEDLPHSDKHAEEGTTKRLDGCLVELCLLCRLVLEPRVIGQPFWVNDQLTREGNLAWVAFHLPWPAERDHAADPETQPQAAISVDGSNLPDKPCCSRKEYSAHDAHENAHAGEQTLLPHGELRVRVPQRHLRVDDGIGKREGSNGIGDQNVASMRRRLEQKNLASLADAQL